MNEKSTSPPSFLEPSDLPSRDDKLSLGSLSQSTSFVLQTPRVVLTKLEESQLAAHLPKKFAISDARPVKLSTSPAHRLTKKCHICLRTMPHRRWRRHLEECHLTSSYAAPVSVSPKDEKIDNKKCRFCGKTFTLSGSRISHEESIHRGKRWRCVACGVSYKHKRNSWDHKCIHGGPNRFESWFEITNDNKPDRRFEGKSYPCHFCSQLFVSPHGRNQHEKNIHKKTPSAVSLLNHADGSKTSSIDRLNSRKKYKGQHEDGVKKRRQCPHCPKVFTSYQGMRDHILFHKKKRWTCNKCDSVYSTPTSAYKHKKVHSSGCSFTTWFEKSESKGELKKRRNQSKSTDKVDLKETSFRNFKAKKSKNGDTKDGKKKSAECPYCSKVFTSSHGKCVHIDCIHKKKRWICKQCGSVYSSHSAVYRHRKYHHHNTFTIRFENSEFASTSEKRKISSRSIKPSKPTSFGPKYPNNLEGETSMSKKTNFVRAKKNIFSSQAKQTEKNVPCEEMTNSNQLVFSCKFCQAIYYNRRDRILHEKTVHGDQRWKCLVCGRVCFSVNTMQRHKTFHRKTEFSSWFESISPKSSKFNPKAKRKTVSRIRKSGFKMNRVKCRFCDSTFGSVQTKSEHEKIFHWGKRWCCDSCTSIFRTCKGAKLHKMKHYPTATISISFMNKELSGFVNPALCGKPEKEIRNESCIDDAYKNVNKVEVVQCEKKRDNKKKTLKKIKRIKSLTKRKSKATETFEKPPFEFDTLNEQEKHNKVNYKVTTEGDNDVKYSTRNRFKSFVELREEMLEAQKNPQFLCTICNKTFSSHSMQLHQASHGGKAMFKLYYHYENTDAAVFRQERTVDDENEQGFLHTFNIDRRDELFAVKATNDDDHTFECDNETTDAGNSIFNSEDNEEEGEELMVAVDDADDGFTFDSDEDDVELADPASEMKMPNSNGATLSASESTKSCFDSINTTSSSSSTVSAIADSFKSISPASSIISASSRNEDEKNQFRQVLGVSRCATSETNGLEQSDDNLLLKEKFKEMNKQIHFQALQQQEFNRFILDRLVEVPNLKQPQHSFQHNSEPFSHQPQLMHPLNQLSNSQYFPAHNHNLNFNSKPADQQLSSQNHSGQDYTSLSPKLSVLPQYPTRQFHDYPDSTQLPSQVTFQDKKSVDCCICYLKFQNQGDDYRSHLMLHMEVFPTESKCPICELDCGCNRLLMEHFMHSHAKVDEILCSEINCNQTFWTEKSMRMHAVEHLLQLN